MLPFLCVNGIELFSRIRAALVSGNDINESISGMSLYQEYTEEVTESVYRVYQSRIFRKYGGDIRLDVE